jgi:hypothetical protein
MTTMSKLRMKLLQPYIQHLSLANRHNVSKPLLSCSDEMFDKAMKQLYSGEVRFSDF